MMRFINGLLVGMIGALGTVVLLLLLWSTPPTPRPVHDYNMLIAGEKSTWKGQEIRANGFCVEIILNERVDTIYCGQVFITEATEDAGDVTLTPHESLTSHVGG